MIDAAMEIARRRSRAAAGRGTIMTKTTLMAAMGNR
jgi:hypothetical protein